MLAQSFKSAAELGISKRQLDALRKTLVLLETGKLVHVPESEIGFQVTGRPKFSGHFNMCQSYIITECGTVACIKGTAEMIGNVDLSPDEIPEELINLFYSWGGGDPTTAQAATALRSYLTTGDARWDLAAPRSPQETASE